MFFKHISDTYSGVNIKDYNVAVNLAVTGDNGDEWVLLWDNCFFFLLGFFDFSRAPHREVLIFWGAVFCFRFLCFLLFSGLVAFSCFLVAS